MAVSAEIEAADGEMLVPRPEQTPVVYNDHCQVETDCIGSENTRQIYRAGNTGNGIAARSTVGAGERRGGRHTRVSIIVVTQYRSTQ